MACQPRSLFQGQTRRRIRLLMLLLGLAMLLIAIVRAHHLPHLTWPTMQRRRRLPRYRRTRASLLLRRLHWRRISQRSSLTFSLPRHFPQHQRRAKNEVVWAGARMEVLLCLTP